MADRDGAPQARDESLTIERIGGQGDGVAAGPVFVPFSLPGERVNARVAGDRGDLVEVLSASADRVTPPCPHFGRCGGCALQHWATPPYLAWKREQVRLALAHRGLETDIAETVDCPPASRRRLALHVRPGPSGARLGFKGRGSWSLVDIETCPIADPALVRALPALKRLGAAFLGRAKSAPTLHATLTLSGIDVDVTGVEHAGLGVMADKLGRVAEAAEAGDFARVTQSGEILYQTRQPVVRFGAATVALPAGGFLQATAKAEATMSQLAVDAVKGAKRIADLFCGAGAFSFPLAAVAPVLAADSSAPAITALKSAQASAPGLKPIAAEARDLFRRPLSAQELGKIDAVVFDPPRAGAEAQAHEIAKSKASVVVGVSCAPTTFARDARILVDAGFRLERITPVDQFLWSPHVELVGVFRR
ncbi:MAG TPA: class I SAM-dependent RNA methyltransferase [Caulobacteraceae bacterium]|nr:class I SAM-dependent RNA methyltransferase [Caulobacteraceae bacterium]